MLHLLWSESRFLHGKSNTTKCCKIDITQMVCLKVIVLITNNTKKLLKYFRKFFQKIEWNLQPPQQRGRFCAVNMMHHSTEITRYACTRTANIKSFFCNCVFLWDLKESGANDRYWRIMILWYKVESLRYYHHAISHCFCYYWSAYTDHTGKLTKSMGQNYRWKYCSSNCVSWTRLYGISGDSLWWSDYTICIKRTQKLVALRNIWEMWVKILLLNNIILENF